MSITALFRGRQNQQTRFTHLLRPHVDLMYRMAYRWTGSQHNAEDLVQDVLAKLVEKVDEMERIEQLRPWLMKILYRRYVDIYRRVQRSPVVAAADHGGNGEQDGDLLDNTADSDCQFDRLDLQQALQQALAQLDAGQRDTVLLHDLEGYTAEEVASILDIEPGTVKSRLHRARKKLQNLLHAGTF